GACRWRKSSSEPFQGGRGYIRIGPVPGSHAEGVYMRDRFVVCLLVAGALLSGAAGRGVADDKDPPAKKPRPPAVKVMVDTTEVPELAEWGKKAGALAEKWHPLVADLLHSDGFTPPNAVKIVFKKDMKGVAYT